LQMRSDCVVPTSSPAPPDAARRLRSFMRVTSWPPCSSPRAPASSSTASSISAPRLFPLLPYAADLVKFATAAPVRVRPRALPAIPLHQHGSSFLVVGTVATSRHLHGSLHEVSAPWPRPIAGRRHLCVVRASPTCPQKSGAVKLRFGALYIAGARDSAFSPAGCFILQRALVWKKAPPSEALFYSARGRNC
jgi:hypothetical protein